MRTIVDIPDSVIETLDKVRSKEHRSRASIVREALNDYLNAHHAKNSSDAFGIWRDNITDGVEYQRRLRNEWGD